MAEDKEKPVDQKPPSASTAATSASEAQSEKTDGTTTAAPPKAQAEKRSGAKKTKAAKSKKKKVAATTSPEDAEKSLSRKSGPKPYPTQTFEEALRIGQGIMDKASGQTVKRATLFSELNLSDNKATRALLSLSGRYQITKGGEKSEFLSLEPKGRTAVDPASTPKARQKARFELAVQNIPLFNKLYEQYKGSKLPSLQFMQDHLEELDSGDRPQCVDIFLQNIKFVGLLRTREGAEFVSSVDEFSVLEPSPLTGVEIETVSELNQPSTVEDFDNVCFFIAPIGDAGSEHRRHSDAILASYVERALQNVEPKLKVVRADKIEQPGMISKLIVEYILRSKLVVADLSYQNPNVFYELCLRHVTGKPVIHIRRGGDRIPFDVGNFKTVEIKFDDKFDILAELETIRSTISQYARQAMASEFSSDNPVLTYCPGFRFTRTNER